MPVPLIAAALIAAGSATGGSGAILLGKAARDLKNSRKRIKSAVAQYDATSSLCDLHVGRTNESIRDLGNDQESAWCEVVLRMGEFLRRNERQVKESEALLAAGLHVHGAQLATSNKLDVDPAAWFGGAVASAAAGSTAAAGVTTAAGTLGVASTGAAISGLSGAAAESATLAFLGGGSLASGGGGMALGATALNIVTVGPALLVGGLVIHGQGQKALTQAKRAEAKVAVACAKLDQREAHLDGVDSRISEVRTVLNELRERGVHALDELESEPFDPAIHAERFHRALTLVLAVRDISQTQILTGPGEMSDESAGLKVKYRSLMEDE